MGIYSIKKMAAAKAKGNEKSAGVGIRASYLRVVGIQVDTEGAGTEPDRTAPLKHRGCPSPRQPLILMAINILGLICRCFHPPAP